jgi:hypothetical protein
MHMLCIYIVQCMFAYAIFSKVLDVELCDLIRSYFRIDSRLILMRACNVPVTAEETKY